MRPLTSAPPDLADSGPGTPPLLQPLPPPWVADVMVNARSYDVSSSVHAIESAGVVLLSTTIPGAGHLDADGLRTEVAGAYAAIGDALRSVQCKAIRLWNYLPDPGGLMAPGLDRYMVFNAGRHEGYGRWFGDAGRFERSLATATGVGIPGDDLVVHCLASRFDGHPIENPRQTPAWQYSARYGPLPPSFSRATIASFGERRLLLIGGTASIVGEDSVHVGNLQGQLDETLANLTTLVAAARRDSESHALPLARITDVRVYLTREEHAPTIGSALRKHVPNAARIEMALARLCRPELLVEIEGVAEM